MCIHYGVYYRTKAGKGFKSWMKSALLVENKIALSVLIIWSLFLQINSTCQELGMPSCVDDCCSKETELGTIPAENYTCYAAAVGRDMKKLLSVDKASC